LKIADESGNSAQNAGFLTQSIVGRPMCCPNWTKMAADKFWKQLGSDSPYKQHADLTLRLWQLPVVQFHLRRLCHNRLLTGCSALWADISFLANIRFQPLRSA
jgi:hypothetical protein